jgi:hypothetical protein
MDDPAIRSYRDLRVWQEAITLAEMCYYDTRDFPREEMFGLTAQMRRAAVSIAANIAEGWGRESSVLRSIPAHVSRPGDAHRYCPTRSRALRNSFRCWSGASRSGKCFAV